METDNKNVNPNQKPEPQKEEKKKNKIVAWWLGLNKWARVGICAGTAAVLATAITLPIVLTQGKNTGHDITIIVPQSEPYEQKYLNPNDYPAKIKSTDTSFTYKLKTGAGENATIALNDTSHEEMQLIENSTYAFSEGETEKTVTGLNLTNVTSITIWLNAGQ